MPAPLKSLIAVLLGAALAPAGEITPEGEHLARVLDAMDVEHHWLPGRPVHWRTGQVDPRGRQGATHCSAFVAAACARTGVYILRPPEHRQALLANAQDEWLKAVGDQYGWRRGGSPQEAQQLANRGAIVVVCYRNPYRHWQGHIAIVRPSTKGDGQLAEEGPQVAQAGLRNARSISLRAGFRHHPGAWEGRGVDFFAHAPGPD
jgi:hypothetical protein